MWKKHQNKNVNVKHKSSQSKTLTSNKTSYHIKFYKALLRCPDYTLICQINIENTYILIYNVLQQAKLIKVRRGTPHSISTIDCGRMIRAVKHSFENYTSDHPQNSFSRDLLPPDIK